MKKICLVSVMVVFAIFPKLFAQTEDSVLTDQFATAMTLEELMNVKVVSASKVEQKQEEAPNIIDVLNKNQVQNYGWMSINEMLYSQPGFAPAQDYDRRTLGFRGMTEGWNNNHVVMLIDGIPFNDNLYGTAYTSEITPLVFTESFEIIRGPGGALYGTNALNGVITLNTRKANNLKNNGSFSMRMGSRNTQTYDMIIATDKEHFGVVSSFSTYTTNGVDYESWDDFNGYDTPEKVKIKDKRKSNYFFTNIYGKGRLKGLSFQYHEHQWEYETGHGWLFDVPDFNESLKEYRRIFTLKYSPRDVNRAFNYEVLTKYQKHGIDWNLRYYPNNGYDGTYPSGSTEYLKTDAEDIFFRFQSDYKIQDHKLLGGIEFDRFYYNGDDSHYSNTDLNDTWYPWENNENRNMGSWFEFALNKPVFSGGAFIQYISPKLMNIMQLTLSGRYDRQWFDFVRIYDQDKPEDNKSFGQLTPRAALTITPSEKLGFKIIAGQAFRYPTPTEMFGSNTWTLASNIDALEPEIVTNFDVAASYKVNKNFNIKVNAFMFNFENIIAYSVQNANLSANIYTIKNAGLEATVNYSFKDISGFANLSYSMRLDEEIKDSTITQNTSDITWAPPLTANFGIRYNHNKFMASLLFHYQDEALRRESDRIKHVDDGWVDVSYNVDSIRGYSVGSWMNIDMKIGYNISDHFKAAINVKNLLDQEQFMAKNNAYAFDYQREKRRIYLQLTYDF